ncbi:hypothetical protein [Streptantibioticus ferralitis]|uniref:Uncharacterized protein n=1 Tax=Streptantibioticus ferralitis TaxID=236510 RepID=A0ABT5Z7E1_9ACTN|nr:hypothetical protein [Streptantibioticus ferralitis]MDF2259746.1 hypothetical protein [Streptantibioticus ferralitis]
MTFTWKTPPWERHEDCTHMAVTLTHVGGGEIAVASESVRGDNATDALADLLMGPGGAAKMSLPGLVGVVVRRGIDVMWMAQPPIEAAVSDTGEWTIAVHGVDEADVTAFSADDVRDLLARLRAAYG